MRLRAQRLFVIAGVTVITALLLSPHFERGEHAAHLHRAIRAGAGHHGKGVGGQLHFHFAHIGHAPLTHDHVVGNEFADFLHQTPMVHTDHGGHIVAHGPHGVVALVAVHGPVAGLVSDKLQLPHLAHGHVGGHLGPTRRFGHGAAVGAGHLELNAMDVHRVVGHGQVAHAHAHPVVQARHQRADAREHAAVPAPDVLVQHGVDVGRFGTRRHIKRVEQKRVIAVHLGDQRMRAFGVGDPQAHHAHGHLRHLVSVRVVHEGAGASRHKLVNPGFAHGDLPLVQASHAVHAIGQALAVPVHGGVLGQFVRHINAHLVALNHLDGRAGTLAVVTPHVDDKARCHFAHHRLGHQVELFHTILHAKGQGPTVQGDHRLVGTPCARHARRGPRRRGVGAGLNDGLGQGGQCAAADSRSGDSSPCHSTGHAACGGHGFMKKISALHGQCPAVLGLVGLDVSAASVPGA